MEVLPTGSVQSWLAVVVATLSPLTALIVGFEGADWFLRRRLGRATDGGALASHGRIGRGPGGPVSS